MLDLIAFSADFSSVAFCLFHGQLQVTPPSPFVWELSHVFLLPHCLQQQQQQAEQEQQQRQRQPETTLTPTPSRKLKACLMPLTFDG